jgi:hypothetical protein
MSWFGSRWGQENFSFNKVSKPTAVPTDIIFSGFWGPTDLANYLQQEPVDTILFSLILSCHLQGQIFRTWTYIFFRKTKKYVIPIIPKLSCPRAFVTSVVFIGSMYINLCSYYGVKNWNKLKMKITTETCLFLWAYFKRWDLHKLNCCHGQPHLEEKCLKEEYWELRKTCGLYNSKSLRKIVWKS